MRVLGSISSLQCIMHLLLGDWHGEWVLQNVWKRSNSVRRGIIRVSKRFGLEFTCLVSLLSTLSKHGHTAHPRHLRAALRERRDPPRPPGRVHPDRHLGALPEDARPRGPLRLRGRHARHRDHAAGGEGRHHAPRRSSSACWRSTSATSPASTSSSTTTTRRTRTRRAQLSEDIYLQLKAAGLIDVTPGRAVLRSGQGRCSCRTASSRANAPTATRRTSTATPAKSAARPTARPT